VVLNLNYSLNCETDSSNIVLFKYTVMHELDTWGHLPVTENSYCDGCSENSDAAARTEVQINCRVWCFAVYALIIQERTNILCAKINIVIVQFQLSF